MNNKILIIGGDSKLAQEFIRLCKKKKISFIATSRKRKKNYLELNNVKKFKIPQNIGSCVILGGITDYYKCNKYKEKSRKINTINIPELAFKILRKKIFLCYVSSNTVFNYQTPSPEYKKLNPKFEYAKQKKIAENKLINFSNLNKLDQYLSILRLTKNICQNTMPFKTWIKNINNNENIVAFDDLFFSPILFTNSADILLKILNKKENGIFHLSNKYSLSYYSFAIKLIKYLKLKINVIKKSSTNYGINLFYKNRIASLSMNSTIKKLKVKYINLDEIFNFFKIKINEKKN